MRRGLALAAGAALAALAGGALLVRAEGARLRHLALPVLSDPSGGPAAPAADLAALPGCRAEEVARVGRRVTALLPAGGGALWVGTFDDGVFRVAAGGAARPVEGLSGRERFVNALAAQGGTTWAATQGGLLALGAGRPEPVVGGEGVTALAVAGEVVYAGTARGLLRVAAGRAGRIPVAGPEGEALRVTALAASPPGPGQGEGGGRLWIGTASGAYSLPLAALSGPDGAPAPVAAWHPLVFGDPPAASNVVTALAPLGEGAVAGTDDAGLARLAGDGAVSALRFADPRANEINPGAAAAAGGAALLGTQGGGLLVARARGAALEVARPADLSGAAVSAVWSGGGALLAGTADGVVLRVRCEDRGLALGGPAGGEPR